MYDSGPDYGETRGPLGWVYGLLFGAIWVTLLLYMLWNAFS